MLLKFKTQVKPLKKSTQWDIVGVFGLILGLGIVISLFGEYFPIQFRDTPSDYILWVVVSGIAFMFSLMGFIFGYLEGKKEEFNPSRRYFPSTSET